VISSRINYFDLKTRFAKKGDLVFEKNKIILKVINQNKIILKVINQNKIILKVIRIV